MTGRISHHVAFGILASIVSLLSSLLTTVPSSADEVVEFKSVTYRLSQFQRDRAKARGEADTTNAGLPIKGYLSKPDGTGRFPAIVLLHGCGGYGASDTQRTERIRAWGYVVLAPDSFATRDIKQKCLPDQTYLVRRNDALGALVYLSQLEFVDPERIAVVGYSQGGVAALTIASASQGGVFEMPDALGFKAAVAFYPSCEVIATELAIPTFILNGKLDDWSLASNCELLARRSASRGAELKLSVYPDAYHSFDVTAFAEGRNIFGHWCKYDPDATERSSSEMREFLARLLMPN